MLSAGAAVAGAQLAATVALDPAVARQGAALLVSADSSLLSAGERPADSLTVVLPRGTRVDTAAVDALCSTSDAASSACPETSQVGFGRFGMTVRNFAAWGGEADVVWSLTASLGAPRRRGDVASVVLTAKLLALDNVTTFLVPELGAVPQTATTSGRLLRSGSGLELRFSKLPVDLAVSAPATATPSKLELSLSAVRRVRQNFFRRLKVRTLSGYEIRKIRDHRLVGHHLLRAPRSCRKSWSSELRVAFGADVKRTASPIICGNP